VTVVSMERNSGKSIHRVSLCVCMGFFAIYSFLSLSKFSCFDLHSKSIGLILCMPSKFIFEREIGLHLFPN
jgi:hypothetical protein